MRADRAEPARSGRSMAAACLAAFLCWSCSHAPPNTAIAEYQARPKPPQLVQQDTPLASVIGAHGVQPVDPQSRAGLLPQIARELAKTDPQGRYRGITYNLTAGNALPADWIVQTPDAWGRSARDVKSESLLPQRLQAMIAGARHSVDIAALQPSPDGAFLDAMRQGIAELARSNREVTLRVLVGTYPLGPDFDARALLQKLAADIEAGHGARLSLHVAGMRSCLGGESCSSFTWNHAKFVAVDGARLFSGGHNFWSQDYFDREPVHDLSLFLDGPAAADATGFANALWDFVCRRSASDGTGAAWVFSLKPGGEIGNDCLARLVPPPSPARGRLDVLSVARLGAGLTDDFANHNDLARDLLLGSARKSIYIAQQDIAFTLGRADPLWPESTLERLADFLLRDAGDLFIVLSNPNARAPAGESYSNGVSPETVARKIRDVVLSRGDSRSAVDVDRLLCRRLHVAPLRFGPDASWPENRPFANHSKFFMVDARAFHIGSDNFYPVNLQEFGIMIDDRAAAAQVKRDYWDPLWRWSRAAAVIGGDSGNCLFETRTAGR